MRRDLRSTATNRHNNATMLALLCTFENILCENQFNLSQSSLPFNGGIENEQLSVVRRPGER